MSIKNGLARKRDEDWRKYAKAVREGQRDFVKTGTALGMLRVDDHHKEQGYASFEELVEAEFDMPKSTAYRLIEAARVVTVLSQLGTIQSKITNQAQALALSPIRRDGAALLAVIESAEASGRITAASLEAARIELYPHAKVIDGEIVPEKPALVKGMRRAIEKAAEPKPSPDAFSCELCSKPLSVDELGNGFTRCGACDPNGAHVAEPLDGGLWGDCLMCRTETSAAGPAANPEDASPVLGEPVEVEQPPAGTGPEPVVTGLGSGPQDSPAAESASSPHAGVPAVGDQIEERDEEEAAEPPADLPAAATTSLPDGDGNPMPEQPQQPGQDYPPVLGSEGFPGRAETDHHRAGVSGGEARVASQERATAEPVELEDGGVLPPESPSSSDPAVLLRLFAEFLYALDRTDIDVIAPLLLTEEMQQLHEAADRVATFVGLLETWRTP